MENSDKIYLLMEVLGHDVTRQRNARYHQIITGEKYEQVFKELWMMRVQPGEKAEQITQRISKLKDWKINSYYDVAAFAHEIDMVQTRGNELVVINPYIYNSYRQYPVKTVGELKIPYAKTEIDINEYILGAEIAADKKVRFLANSANEWYEIAENDISNGIEKTTENIKTMEGYKPFHFPLLSFFQVVLAITLFATLWYTTTSSDVVFDVIRTVKFKTDSIAVVLFFANILITLFSFIFISIYKQAGRSFYRRLLNTLHHNLINYQNLMAMLARKHASLGMAIEKAVNNKTFLRVSFESIGVLTPVTYAFDNFNFQERALTKKQYCKATKKVFITSIIFFTLSLVSFAALIAKCLGVF